MQCANCGEHNPEAYQFCGTCGAALVAAPVAQSEPDDALPSPYWNQPAPAMAHQSGSRRARMILIGAVAAGLVVCVCAVCLIGGAASWYMLNSTVPSASDSAPTSTEPAQLPTPGSTELAPLPTSVAGLKWNTAQVLAALKAAGLEAEKPQPMTKEDYGQVPMTAAEAVRFFMPSLGGTKGGRVYAFATNADLEKVRKYYLSGSGAAAPPWIFVRDNILVQINGELPSERAQRYMSALNAMK